MERSGPVAQPRSPRSAGRPDLAGRGGSGTRTEPARHDHAARNDRSRRRLHGRIRRPHASSRRDSAHGGLASIRGRRRSTRFSPTRSPPAATSANAVRAPVRARSRRDQPRWRCRQCRELAWQPTVGTLRCRAPHERDRGGRSTRVHASRPRVSRPRVSRPGAAAQRCVAGRAPRHRSAHRISRYGFPEGAAE